MKEPLSDHERLIRIADVLDPHVKRWLMLNDADMSLAALVLRTEASRRMKAADAGRPVRHEPS